MVVLVVTSARWMTGTVLPIPSATGLCGKIAAKWRAFSTSFENNTASATSLVLEWSSLIRSRNHGMITPSPCRTCCSRTTSRFLRKTKLRSIRQLAPRATRPLSATCSRTRALACGKPLTARRSRFRKTPRIGIARFWRIRTPLSAAWDVPAGR